MMAPHFLLLVKWLERPYQQWRLGTSQQKTVYLFVVCWVEFEIAVSVWWQLVVVVTDL